MDDWISDEEAVNRVRGGDSGAYEILVNRHQGRLRRLALGFLRNEADAEDAVQEAHLLALQHLDQFAGRSTFLSWISTITVNQALTHIRRAKGSFVSCEDLLEPLRCPALNPERQAMGRELGLVVRGALRTLPVTYRTVFQLREVQNLSTAETGERLGLKAACVKTRLLRARVMMRKSVSARLGGAAAGYRGQDKAQPAASC